MGRNSPERAEQVFVRQVFGDGRHEWQGRREDIIGVGHDRRSMPGAAPVAADVIQDRHQPGAAVRPGRVAVKGFERLPERILNEIFRLVAIPLEPHRHPEQASRVRERFGLESGPRRVAVGDVLCHLNPEGRPDHTRR
jgi:hypothetical protein